MPDGDIVIERRNVLEEGRQALRLMREAYPQLIELEQRYGPEYAATQAAIALARNDAEIEGIEKNFPRFREALLGSSPEIASANQAIQDRLANLGPSEIETELQRLAIEDLRQGDRLSVEDERNAVQTARAGMSARGLAAGRGAVFAEVLNRQRYADARERERRGFAASVDAYTNQREASDAATANNAFAQYSAYWDPQQRIYGSGGSAVSGSVNPAANFAPFLGASQDVGEANQLASAQEAQLNFERERFFTEREDAYEFFDRNAAIDASNAAANRKAANKSAAIGAAGSVASAALLAFML